MSFGAVSATSELFRADKKWNIPQQEPPSRKQNLPQSDKLGSEPQVRIPDHGDHWFRAMVIAIPGARVFEKPHEFG
jgi:hypothetical protein